MTAPHKKVTFNEMTKKEHIYELVNLCRQILPKLQNVADEYDGKRKVLNAILEDLAAERKSLMEYKEEQIADCENSLLGMTDDIASEDAEKILELISEKFKSQNRRLRELGEIERKLHSNIRPVEQIQESLSQYIESVSEIIPLVSDRKRNNDKTDNTDEKTDA